MDTKGPQTRAFRRFAGRPASPRWGAIGVQSLQRGAKSRPKGLIALMPRTYGSGRLYVKSGAYYARWRAPDGRYLNRRLGKVRSRGESEGLTRKDAERAIRHLM